MKWPSEYELNEMDRWLSRFLGQDDDDVQQEAIVVRLRALIELVRRHASDDAILAANPLRYFDPGV